MNYRVPFRIILLVFIFFIASCGINKNMHIVIFNETQKEYVINYLLFKNYEITDNGSYIIIKNINKNILIDILYILNLNIDIIKDNIVNVDTTRTVDGGPFLRSFLKVTKENGTEILKDSSPARLVFDPVHPDAIRNGTLEGYVQYSNIDLITEYYDLIETIQLYNSIVDYIKSNYKQIAIEKINIMTVEEVKYNNRIEKLLELLLRFSIENGIKK